MPRRAITVMLACVIATGCAWMRGEVWEGVFYPNRNDLALFIRIGQFPTLSACRRAATGLAAQFERFGNGTEPTYECGLNCRPADFDAELHVCYRTEK